jgi:hypothetical protein
MDLIGNMALIDTLLLVDLIGFFSFGAFAIVLLIILLMVNDVIK